MKKWVLFAALAAIAWFWMEREPAMHPPGVLVPAAPAQAATDRAALHHDGYQLTPQASFQVQALVLGREDYRFDRGAELAPVDLALGWQQMSDSAVLRHVDVRQSNRFYFWEVQSFPIPRENIESMSANMHMIPANARVADALDDVRAGEVVAFSGLLVDARAPDGWHWNTSLTRNDTGNGACELVWVEQISVISRP